MSVPNTRAPGTSLAIESATAPPPVARSTATGRRRRARRRIACSARNSVESRGTNTPGRAAISSPRKTAWPMISCTGSPSARRSIIRPKRRRTAGGTSSPGRTRSTPMAKRNSSSASIFSRSRCQWSIAVEAFSVTTASASTSLAFIGRACYLRAAAFTGRSVTRYPAATIARMAEASQPSEPRPKKPRRKRSSGTSSEEIRLTGDRIVVENPDNGERTSRGGLLIPATAAPAPKRRDWGEVLLVGPDVRTARTGDRILYLPQAGLEVELEGRDCLLLRERDVQAVSSSPDGKERQPGLYL